MVFSMLKSLPVTLKNICEDIFPILKCPKFKYRHAVTQESQALQAGLGEAKVTNSDDATDQLWNVLILSSPLRT